MFYLKFKLLLDKIISENSIFKLKITNIWVIKYQKRGMLYAYILLQLEEHYCLNKAKIIDKVILAKLFNPNKYRGQELFNIILKYFIYNPYNKYNLNTSYIVKQNNK